MYHVQPKEVKKSLIYIKKRSGSRIDPCGTPAEIFDHLECWPFKTTLCLLSFRKSIEIFNKLTVTPFCFNLKIRPLCQTLSLMKHVILICQQRCVLQNHPSKAHQSFSVTEIWQFGIGFCQITFKHNVNCQFNFFSL